MLNAEGQWEYAFLSLFHLPIELSKNKSWLGLVGLVYQIGGQSPDKAYVAAVESRLARTAVRLSNSSTLGMEVGSRGDMPRLRLEGFMFSSEAGVHGIVLALNTGLLFGLTQSSFQINTGPLWIGLCTPDDPQKTLKTYKSNIFGLPLGLPGPLETY